MIVITLILFALYTSFQLLYIFIPLFSIKNNKYQKLFFEQRMSILVPAYNEEKTIMQCIQGIQLVHYENYEALIVNDGSTDNTLPLLIEQLQLSPISRTANGAINTAAVHTIYQSTLNPKIFVIDKENGGKADALNTGINFATGDITITLDADSVLAPDALEAMNSAFAHPLTVAAGGMVQIAQGYRGDLQKPKPIFNVKSIIKYQIIAYLTDFYLHKTTQQKLRSIVVIAGAFGAFRQQVLLAVNGYRKTVGEDMEVTLRIQQYIKKRGLKERILFVPSAVCYTECPSNLKNLFIQRIRWQKGFIDCIVKFRKSFFTKLSLPVSIYLLFDSFILGTVNAFPTIMIPIFVLIFQNFDIAIAFLVITYVLALYRSFAAILISWRYNHRYSIQDYMKIMLFLPIEITTFRLLGLLFVSIGTVHYLKNKDSWHSIERVGVHRHALIIREEP